MICLIGFVVCDTAKVRFFKQITTITPTNAKHRMLFAILQKYDFSSKSQPTSRLQENFSVVCDTAKVRFFKQITTTTLSAILINRLFAILQKYDFSSKSQLNHIANVQRKSCLRYCKSTIFQANHNYFGITKISDMLFAILQKYDFSSKSQLVLVVPTHLNVVCDTAKVRFFKQITTFSCRL